MSGPVNRSLAVLATGCSTVEDCQMLVFQLRRALYRVVAEYEVVGRVYLRGGEAEEAEGVEERVLVLGFRHPKSPDAELLAENRGGESGADIEHITHLLLYTPQSIAGEAEVLQPLRGESGATNQATCSHDVLLDGLGLPVRVTEPAQRTRHTFVDDSQRAAASQSFVLHKRELRLYASGIRTHH